MNPVDPLSGAIRDVASGLGARYNRQAAVACVNEFDLPETRRGSPWVHTRGRVRPVGGRSADPVRYT